MTGGFDAAAHLPALQIVTPLIGAVVCAAVRQRHLCLAITIVVSLAMPVIAFALLAQVQAQGTVSYALGGFPPPLGIEYRVDAPNALRMTTG